MYCTPNEIKNTNFKFCSSCAKAIVFLIALNLGACVSFSDATKTVVADNNVTVIIPENKSSFSVAFHAPCMAYVCAVFPDRPFDLDYNPAYDTASNLQKIFDARGKKFGRRYYLKLVDAHSEISLYAIKNHVIYSLKAELSDEARKIIDKSVCSNVEIYRLGSIDIWRRDPEVLKNELHIIANKCLGTFRKELDL
jgi:hypothetical protein